MEESTHIIFEGGNLHLSTNLSPILNFLQEIEKEIESLFGLDKKLESIRNQYLETIGFVKLLTDKLKEHSIDFEYTFSELPETINEKLTNYRPTRVEVITLFAYLETLFCLKIAYEKQTSDKGLIIKEAMSQESTRAFLNDFCISKDNPWVQKNPERAKRISAEDLRQLRNSLTHFFSVDKAISLSSEQLSSHSRKLEKASNFSFSFLSPEDLYEILRGAGVLLMREWAADYIAESQGKTTGFKKKILCVKDVVEGYGVKVVEGSLIDTSQL